MQLYENNKDTKESKINNILKMSIIAISVLIVILIILIVLLSGRKTVTQSATIDGKIQNEIFKLIQYEDLGNDQVKLWIPIKEIAPYLGYKAYNGSNNSATEDKNKCYVITEENSNSEIQNNIKEVANFEVNSKNILKLDLTNSGSDYETLEIENEVIAKDDTLYTTIEGIEKAFNVLFEYDSENKQITIYTLPFLVDFYQKQIQNGKYSGYNELDIKSTSNQKAILNGILIVNSGTNKYGAINAETGKTILEAKYDGISYMQKDSKFLIYTNKKYGIISESGKTLIDPEYDSLKAIDLKRDYYLAKKNNLYGIINGVGKEVIYIENEQIGIDISAYEKNEVKNGYILLDKLIPVMKNKKWAFYDVSGNKLTNFVYDSIGCSSDTGNNTYGLLIIPDYNLVVVNKDKKYAFINQSGKDNIISFSFDKMYLKIESGQLKYCMQANNKEYNILKTLESIVK